MKKTSSMPRPGSNLIWEIIPDGDFAPSLKQPWWKWTHPPFASFVVKDTWAHEWQGIIRLFHLHVFTPEVTLNAVGLGGVYVSEHARGEGIGIAMLSQCLSRLEAMNYGEVAVLWAMAHRDLYLMAGFTEVEVPGLWMKSLSPSIEIHRGHHTWRVKPEEKF